MKNKIKEWLIITAMKTAIAGVVFGGMVGACACAESFLGDCTEYTPINVMLIGDNLAIDGEGTTYTVKTDKYKYGDIISVTLNPHGKVVGINGRCWIQSLD